MNNDYSQKKQSQENIRMPKSNYQKALEYYKLEDKSVKFIANRMKIKPKTYSNKKNVSLRELIETELVKRWNDDSKDVGASFNLTFQRYNKETKKYSDGVIKFYVRGDKRDIPRLAKEKFNKRVNDLLEDYDEWKDFDYYQSGDFIEMKEREGSGINNGKEITTTKGGQRIVGMKGNKAVIKMRNRFALKFADTEDNDWDRGEGTCVFDYIYAKYKCKELNGTIRKPKKREDAYRWLDELLRIDETERPLQEGVSVYQLENFCDEFETNMYVYDETDGLIECYKPKKTTKVHQVLMFRVFDGHFHPCNDEKRLSVSSKSRKGGNIRSNDIETFEKTNKEIYNTKREVIAPTQEEYDAIKADLKEKKYPVSVRNQIAINYLKTNEMIIPFPITEQSLVIDEGSIVKIRYDDKIVLTEPINPKLKKWYEDNGEEYNGEGYINIMNRLWLNKYGFLPNNAPFLSKPNVEVMNALSAGKVKWRTHLGLTEAGQKYSQVDIIDMLRNENAIGVDICKCYCDALYNPRERWIVFNGKEQLEVYDKKPLTLGLYFVITNDMTLFHKSNWYSKQIIMKAKEEGIYYKITHQIRCVDVVWEKEKYNEKEEKTLWKLDNENLFKPIIDEIVELTEQDEDFTITKIVINAISGYLGKTNYKTKTASINTNLKDIWENWIVGDKDKIITNNEDIYLNEIKNGDTSFYIYGVETQKENLSTGLPMYIQILDSANIALYDMTKAVGGTCIYRKTDCIISIGGKLPEEKIAKYPCSYQDTWGTYRLVDDAKNYNYSEVMNVCRAVDIPRLSQDWEYWDFNDSDDWKLILETAISKGGMLISGRAGTGKSHIIKKGIEEGILSADIKTRMASTNKAARNINGITIHKNLALSSCLKTNSKTLQSLKKYNIFVIDEISMIYAELWNKLCLLKKTTGAIFILLGDYRQCPPIEDGKEIDYFNHPYVKYLSNYNTCELTKPQRYDLPLWNWLEDFYEEGKCDYEVISKKKLTIENILYRKNIVYYNNTRETINELCMKERIKSITKYMVLEVPENCKNDKSQLTYIYKDLPIMAVVGNTDYGIINSDDLIVEDFDPNASTIYITGEFLKDGYIVVECKDFHNLFVVNYAATTHKSQGATITEDLNIFDWDKLQDDRRVGYTAVSRAKTPNQITIVENFDEYRSR